jgi:hypothetical protein
VTETVQPDAIRTEQLPPAVRRRWVVVVGAAAALTAAMVVWSWVGDDGPAAPPAATVAAMTPTATVTPAGTERDQPAPLAPTRSALPWPNPPIDHSPHVMGRPGNGPLASDADGLSLVYVNSLGRPTVIDLASGDREELDVASTRRFDQFEIEAGHVVVSTDRRPEVGTGAITVRVHRTQLFALPSSTPTPTGIDLCLASVCPQLSAIGVDDPDLGDAGIEMVDVDKHPDLARLLSGESGRDGRFDTVTFDGVTTRIPTPGPGPVWMVRTPESVAATSG